MKKIIEPKAVFLFIPFALHFRSIDSKTVLSPGNKLLQEHGLLH